MQWPLGGLYGLPPGKAVCQECMAREGNNGGLVPLVAAGTVGLCAQDA